MYHAHIYWANYYFYRIASKKRERDLESEMAVSRSRMSLVLLMLLAAFDVAKTQEAHGVLATYNLYNPESINWDMRKASTFCATWDADMPLPWRQRYGWTAFCGPAGAHGEPSCGRCILVRIASI